MQENSVSVIEQDLRQIADMLLLIGVGIDYLIRNNFLNVEDDVCEDFDARMVRAVLYDPVARRSVPPRRSSPEKHTLISSNGIARFRK